MGIREYLVYKIGRKISDEMWIKIKYFRWMKKFPNLKNPKKFNEKINWLKLYDRNPLYTKMVDKYEVRNYISEKLGEEYLIPLIGVWNNPEEINFDLLPEQFVLKCNHNSGTGMCICKDKSKLDIEKVKEGLRQGLNEDYFLASREWPYKDVKRKVICEKYMKDEKKSEKEELTDYKFMCFGGKVEYIFTCTERFSKEGVKVTFFDREWNVMPFERHYPKSEEEISKPKNYEKMIEYAEKLSKGIPFVRVDFYEIDGKIYFGELTFYPGSGYEEFTPDIWDKKLGDLIKLPEVV